MLLFLEATSSSRRRETEALRWCDGNDAIYKAFEAKKASGELSVLIGFEEWYDDQYPNRPFHIDATGSLYDLQGNLIATPSEAGANNPDHDDDDDDDHTPGGNAA